MQIQNEFPWFQLSILLVVGAVAAGVAFWLVDHRTAVPNSEIIIAILLAAFFVCFSWALIRFLRWRDRRLGVSVKGQNYQEELAGTIYGLIPGAAYRVIQSFTDYYGNNFQQGELLHFRERHFLPYHGGHTIVFEGKPLYLQENENEELIANFSDYIERIER
ncbi:MAG TPA: DUF3601 domain-containing protein [Blastocatellia bacterium]|nr:DUF3601 domain-containing protein [Blastocatellia bacterium]